MSHSIVDQCCFFPWRLKPLLAAGLAAAAPVGWVWAGFWLSQQVVGLAAPAVAAAAVGVILVLSLIIVVFNCFGRIKRSHNTHCKRHASARGGAPSLCKPVSANILAAWRMAGSQPSIIRYLGFLDVELRILAYCEQAVSRSRLPGDNENLRKLGRLAERADGSLIRNMDLDLKDKTIWRIASARLIMCRSLSNGGIQAACARRDAHHHGWARHWHRTVPRLFGETPSHLRFREKLALFRRPETFHRFSL